MYSEYKVNANENAKIKVIYNVSDAKINKMQMQKIVQAATLLA